MNMYMDYPFCNHQSSESNFMKWNIKYVKNC